MPRATDTTTATELLAGLSEEEREKLVAELLESKRAPARQMEARPLTPRERAIRLLLPERSHMEGCPIIDNPDQAVGRVEGYSDVQPAMPARGRPVPAIVTIARCMECGGSRLHPGRLEDNLLKALGQPSTAAPDLDTIL